ncbi:hypothetical protein EJ03DRAFT_326339 [Teratosphaeria nubilosa]|uniref:Uncharacterized protein n=1 Tax=Teratosphaeria nubilosa TaxID=161662 RepID=A0A6G1LE47_9PEZI|nr:hypothetical protein EJ03DRAFT_326339 [Teratosphaeria nubilosa]
MSTQATCGSVPPFPASPSRARRSTSGRYVPASYQAPQQQGAPSTSGYSYANGVPMPLPSRALGPPPPPTQSAPILHPVVAAQPPHPPNGYMPTQPPPLATGADPTHGSKEPQASTRGRHSHDSRPSRADSHRSYRSYNSRRSSDEDYEAEKQRRRRERRAREQMELDRHRKPTYGDTVVAILKRLKSLVE